MRHFGLVGVDADRNIELVRKPLNDRNDSPHLYVGRHLGEPGARRFAADIDNVRAILTHLDGPTNGSVHVIAQAIAGEGVGGDVHDPHNVRALAPAELAAANGDRGGSLGSRRSHAEYNSSRHGWAAVWIRAPRAAGRDRLAGRTPRGPFSPHRRLRRIPGLPAPSH